MIIVNHFKIYFYFPIIGNKNLVNKNHCIGEEEKASNDFNKNKYTLSPYVVYIFYLILSAHQIKFGFYDIKRSSLIKEE